MSVNIQMADGTLCRVASMNGTDQQLAALQIDDFLSLQSTRPVQNKVITENLSILQDNILILSELVEDLSLDVEDFENAVESGIIDTVFYTTNDEILVTSNDEYISYTEPFNI